MVGRAAILTLSVPAALMLAAASAGALFEGGEHVQNALAALAENRPARAERLAAGAVRSGRDGSWRAWLIVATARHRQGQHASAIRAYRQFLELCQDPSERAYVAEQMRLCELACRPSPRPVRLSRLLSAGQRAGLAQVDSREHIESSEHFVVRAYNSRLAKLVAQQAEIALRRICQTILSGQEYPHSVQVYVWPDVKVYGKHAVTAAEWSGGSFSLRRDEDGLLTRRIDLTQNDQAGQFDATMLDRVLPHELCHLVLAELFGDSICPLALNEGLAMMAEAYVENSRVRLAGAALAGSSKIPLEKLLLMRSCEAGNAAVFYAEAFSLTSYLHARLSGGQFREVLEHIKAGRPLDEAVQRALYVPQDEAFLQQLTRAWENEAIRQSQFLKALEQASDGTT